MNKFLFNILFLGVTMLHPFVQDLNAQTLHTINYTSDDGVPSSETYSVIQDSKGFIWIGTDRGVSRFDGYRFKNFTTVEGLPDNTVFDIYEDADGRIWFLSYSGRLSYFSDNKIFIYKWNDKLDSILPGVKIARSFMAVSDEEVIISYLNRGVYHISEGGKIEEIKVFSDTTAYRNFFFKLVNNRVFAGSKLVNKGQKTNFIVELEDNISSTSIQLQDNSSSDIRILKRKNGSYVIMLTRNIFSYDKGILKEVFFDPGITLHNIYEDNDSCLWVATRRKGVIRVESNGWPDTGKSEVFLEGKTITSIFQDREHGYWFSTLESGILYSPSIAFRSYKTETVSPAGAVTGYKNLICAGFNNGNIECIQHLQTVRKYSVVNSQDGSDYVQALLYDNLTKSLWAGTSKYLWRIQDSESPKVVFSNPTRSVIMGNDGTIWTSGILIARHTSTGNAEYVKPQSNKSIRIVYPASDGTVWAGDLTGLYKISGDSLVPEKHALLNTRISCISELKDGTLIIGTMNHGIVFKKKSKIWSIRQRDGLSGDLISAFYVNDNIIWVANNGGLDRVTITEHGLKTENFTIFHGLPTNEIKQVYANSDTVWLATSKGLVFFLYEEFKRNLTPPEIYIESVWINNSAVALSGSEFSYDKNYVTFNYTGISFRMKKNILYKYRLKGFSEDWLYTQNTSVSFASLPPGNYNFEVYAKNEDGIWSKRPAVYSFVIYPPFWNRWWFYLCMIILFFGIIGLRFRYVKQKNEMKNRLLEFQHQALAAQMNPHFIFNSLYAIQSFVLKEDRVHASKYLSRFSLLMRKSLENSRKKLVPINEEIELIRSYLDLEQMRYKGKFDYTIELDSEINLSKTHIPSMLLQPFIENAIIHGVNHLPENIKGVIKIEIKHHSKGLSCKIEDNGIGRVKSGLFQSEKLNKQSFGTSITEERLKILCKELKGSYYLNVEDKFGENLQPAGTIITFNLPFVIRDNESPAN